MRKFLMSLTVAAAATVAAASVASAAPLTVPLPVHAGPAEVQTVQYYNGHRGHDWRRREAYERHRRMEARRHWQHHHRRYYSGR